MTSYATDRKIKIIQERLGPDWETQMNGLSVDAMYNQIVGDTRKNLFCKIDFQIKEKLDVMVDDHNVKMSEFIEQLIEREFKRFLAEKEQLKVDLAKQFSA